MAFFGLFWPFLAFFGLFWQQRPKWNSHSVLQYTKNLPYQFSLATISSFQDHSNIPELRTNRNQLVNIYLMNGFSLPHFSSFESPSEFWCFGFFFKIVMVKTWSAKGHEFKSQDPNFLLSLICTNWNIFIFQKSKFSIIQCLNFVLSLT